MRPRLAKQDTCKHALDAEAGRHFMGEAALLPAEWAEMAGRAAWGCGALWGGSGVKKGCGVRKGQGCLGSCEEMLK